MFQIVIIMLKGTSGVVRRVYVDAFDFAHVFFFEGFQGKQIVSVNKHIFCVRGLFRVGKAAVFN